jgi:hypothetical protein
MAGSDGNDVSASDLQFSQFPSHALFIQRALVSVLLPYIYLFCFGWLVTTKKKLPSLKKKI